MKIKTEVTRTEKIDIEIDETEAFKILCKTLRMEWIFYESLKYYVCEDEYGNRTVWKVKSGGDFEVDDRGDLYIALCNLAENIFPNCELRNPRIVKKGE